MTLFGVATRMELARDGKYWHVMKDGTVVGLPSPKPKELAGSLAPGEEESGPSILECGVAKRFNWSYVCGYYREQDRIAFSFKCEAFTSWFHFRDFVID